MKKYQKYKESRNSFIGEIPEHWEIYRLGMLGKFSSSGINKESHEEEVSVRMVNYTDITSTRGRNPILSSKFNYMEVTTPKSKLDEHKLSKGDMVFIPSSETSEDLGVSSLIDFEDDKIVYSYHIIRFKPWKQIYHYFKKYLVNHNAVLSQFSSEGKGTTRQIIGRYVFKNVKVVLPPLSEQKKIVEYLDEKTSKLDQLIQSKKQKIELLKEKRTALINKSVTKGLNHDVEMKDSGVEWIGKIPINWKESKFGYYIRLRHGHQFRDNDFTDTGIKIIKITQLNKNGYLDLSNCSTIDPERLEKFQDIKIQQGDILMCLTGGTIGKIIKVGEVKETLLQNYRVGHFSPVDKDSFSNDYVFYLMSSEVIQKQILFDVRETGQPNIGMEDMNNMRIPVPPLNVQNEIVQYLDYETQTINSTIFLEKKKIRILKEYKISLISEVVTGKVNVQEEVDEVLV